jgi:hypothetical protein
MSMQAYFEQFTNLVDVSNHIGGSFGIKPGVLDQYTILKGKIMYNLNENEKQYTKEQCLAITVITVLTRFGQLIENFHLTIDVFANDKLLKNICKVQTEMDIYCTAGSTSTNMVGDLEGYGTVWYYPGGITNILSLVCVIEHGNKVT